MNDEQTIFALASAPGRAGVAVFRISGKDAQKAITLLCKPNMLPTPRQASMRRLHHPQSGEAVDYTLVLFFESPHSFTGEDVVEFHTHGGRAVIQAVTGLLQQMPDFRLAEAGEFTRRAFENGKMDLTEAEAIADLVHAETEAQRRQALRQLDGELGRLYETWREKLARSLSYMEAAIDFADEELPDDLITQQTTALQNLRRAIAAHLNDNRRGERLREGFSIAIIGAPNAGKSSLLNALAQRDAAIVSPVVGTTRDMIDVHLDIGGYPVTLTDTAGLRDSGDMIESEGIRRALMRAAQADLKILVVDSTAPIPDAMSQQLIDEATIIVMNKCDLAPAAAAPYSGTVIHLSASKGDGLQKLIEILTQKIDRRFAAHVAPPLTRARHRAALNECLNHLDRALAASQPDLRAEDVRLAMRSLGTITGRVDVEDLLDIIFRDFCIGK